MAVPSYYATSFVRASQGGVMDVADWITLIDTALTVSLPLADRWTKLGSTYTSPVDPDTGFFIQATITREAADQMRMIVQDQNLAVVQNGNADINVAGSLVKVFAGPKHLYCEGNGEWAGCAMVDPSPEAANMPSIVVYANTIRDTGNNVPFFVDIPERWFANDAIGGRWGRFTGPWFAPNPGANGRLLTAGGSEVVFPVRAIEFNGPGVANDRFTGNVFQFAWVDYQHSPGSIVSVPIDVGVQGSFEVTSLGIMGGQTFGQVQAARLAVRRP